MLDVQLDRVRRRRGYARAAPQTSQVIHWIIRADHLAEMATEASDEAVILLGFGGEILRQDAAGCLNRIQRRQPGLRNNPAPRVVTHTVDLLRAVTAPGVWQALWEFVIELTDADGGQC